MKHFDPMALAKLKKIADYEAKQLRAVLVCLGPLYVLAVINEWYKVADDIVWVASSQLLQHVLGVLALALLDLLPGVVAVGAAVYLTSQFVAVLYDLKDWREGWDHICRGLFGQPGLSPIVIVAEGKIKDVASDKILTKIGGPGGILVYNDSAVLLERGGRLTRVLGPGSIGSLGLFERIRTVVDLRPMRWEYKVGALSKEGIPVSLSADVNFQIDTEGRTPTDKMPYPVSNDTIFKAASCEWVRDPSGSKGDQFFDWVQRVIISNTEGSLRGIIARYTLDQLIGLDIRPGTGTNLPRKAIKDDLTEELKKSGAALGVQINEVQIGAIEVDDEVTKKWIDAWWSYWQGWAMVQERTGEARRQELREKARVRAQAEMVSTVATGFQDLIDADVQIPPRLLYVRMVEVLSRSSLDPSMRCYMSKDALNMLDTLRDLVE
ncbi:MAG: hypothetical protein JXD18_15545 [Anaerolineae bacterium]|nr:hypothetical protein [Anaerolineae bacterium]